MRISVIPVNLKPHSYIGLMHDDVLYETPDVEEAIRRLPAKVVDERNFRLIRALQLSGQKKFLPREEWTKYEQVDETVPHK